MVERTEFEMLKFIMQQNNTIAFMIGTKTKKDKKYYFEHFKEISEKFANDMEDAE